MGAAWTLVLVVVVVVVASVVLLARVGRDRAARHREVADAAHTVRYDVPPGQDPAAVLAAVAQGGFETVVDPVDSHAVTVKLPLGPEQREEVRVLIENEALQTLDPSDSPAAGDVPQGAVRFADERR